MIKTLTDRAATPYTAANPGTRAVVIKRSPAEPAYLSSQALNHALNPFVRAGCPDPYIPIYSDAVVHHGRYVALERTR